MPHPRLQLHSMTSTRSNGPKEYKTAYTRTLCTDRGVQGYEVGDPFLPRESSYAKCEQPGADRCEGGPIVRICATSARWIYKTWLRPGEPPSMLGDRDRLPGDRPAQDPDADLPSPMVGWKAAKRRTGGGRPGVPGWLAGSMLADGRLLGEGEGEGEGVAEG